MLNSIICGATLYALVLISVAIIIPYTDLLGQNTRGLPALWLTWPSELRRH